MQDRVWLRVILRAHRSTSGDSVRAWLLRWKWPAELDKSELSAGGSRHYVRVKVEAGQDRRALEKEIRTAWRGYLRYSRGPKAPD